MRCLLIVLLLRLYGYCPSEGDADTACSRDECVARINLYQEAKISLEHFAMPILKRAIKSEQVSEIVGRIGVNCAVTPGFCKCWKRRARALWSSENINLLQKEVRADLITFESQYHCHIKQLIWTKKLDPEVDKQISYAYSCLYDNVFMTLNSYYKTMICMGVIMCLVEHQLGQIIEKHVVRHLYQHRDKSLDELINGLSGIDVKSSFVQELVLLAENCAYPVALRVLGEDDVCPVLEASKIARVLYSKLLRYNSLLCTRSSVDCLASHPQFSGSTPEDVETLSERL